MNNFAVIMFDIVSVVLLVLYAISLFTGEDIPFLTDTQFQLVTLGLICGMVADVRRSNSG